MPRDHRVEGAETSTGRGLKIAAETVAAVALATGLVALLAPTTPAVRLEALYLLAVLAIAIRRGERAALLTAVLSGLCLNFFFIAPRHQFAIAHARDLVQLVVLMIAAVVVGRLAALARQRAAEAELRAREARLRERQAALLAEVASAILGERTIAAQLETIGRRLAAATGASSARVVAEQAPQPAGRELALPLLADSGHIWMYVAQDTSWSRQDLERLCEPLARLLEVALERDRLAEVAAETEAARRADAARTAILHALSHDLRSPLTAITTAGSALRSEQLSAEDRAELLDVIDHEGTRLAELMSDLLDLSRIQAGAVAPQPDWCDLREIVVAAADGLHTHHPIELALPAELPLVRADATQLGRVFSNLIDNAVKYSPPEEPVRVTAGALAGRVTVRVIDRGRGIPSADRMRVFEPFFRGRSGDGARPAPPGSGLGLAICRGFVEANGGQISLQAGAGRGTSFAVTLPLVAQPAPVEARR